MAADRQPVRYRAGVFQPRLVKWIAALSFVLVIAALELLAHIGLMPALTFPAPSAIGSALTDLVNTGQLWPHLNASLARLGIGWGIGVSTGVLLGVVIGTSTLARSLGLPWVAAISTIPKIALLPLFIIWFGIGEGSKYATIAFGTFFPTVINTFDGISNVDRNLIRMGQAFDLKRRTIVTHIILPATLPSILSAFRISASIGIILLVAAEMVAAQNGIGAYIIQQQSLFQLDRLMAGVVLLMALGLIVYGIIGLLERWLLRWR